MQLARDVARELLELARGELEPVGDHVGVRRAAAAPAGVSSRPPGPRSSSRAPAWRSSAATCWETAGWVSASASAARENEPSRATSRNVSTRRGSIGIGTAYGISETMI